MERPGTRRAKESAEQSDDRGGHGSERRTRHTAPRRLPFLHGRLSGGRFFMTFE
jgi:hypothetical protein